jgi:acyl transferase domain-containing protein
MTGVFPGANHIHEFRENLKNGVESIPFFSDEELGQLASTFLSDTAGVHGNCQNLRSTYGL